MSFKPKVALSNEFLLQLAKLSASVHTKVMKWAIQFQADPQSSGINYENIQRARDQNLKSVRIDKDWRGIVFKPDRGDVYVVLYVDRHEEAYRWAENHQLTINSVTGAMQMLVLDSILEPMLQDVSSHNAASEQDERPQLSPKVPALFADLNDGELMSLGVPSELLAFVRSIATEEELDAKQAKLPLEAYEGLFLVAAGDTVNQVLYARETRLDQIIDTSDFSAALETAESQARFVVVTDDEAMAAILNAPLAQWRVFLHPTQKKLTVGDRSGPVRVLGGAGTGKTVVAMHRAKWLAENRTPVGQKVLMITFTKNLAVDIEQNLRTLCSREAFAKIEVRNLDAWVSAFMRSHKLEHRIVYDRQQDAPYQAWQAALAVKESSLDLPENFYKDELEQVVLAQGITTLDQYRTTRRTGRGVVLGRAKRDAVWPVFEEYRGQLASRKLKEVDDAYREVTEILTAEAKKPEAPPSRYSAIVADETQDLGPQALRLLRALVPAAPNDLLFVGDGHQRIYSRNKAAMSRCGIDIRGRAKKLYLNYRTTDEIRKQAVALLQGCEIDDLDEGADESKRYKSLSSGPAPKIENVDGIEMAAQYAIEFLRQWRVEQDARASLSFCVIAPTEKIRNALGKLIQAAGLRCVAITAQNNHADALEVVHLATMHRAKGLEFDSVVVVAPNDYLGDPEETATKRKLLYVALTRAKRGAQLLLLN